jgi:DNA-directed RNA polymerase specialized sigma subunit
MIFQTFLLISIYCVFSFNTQYLTATQWGHIRSILRNPSTTENIKKTIRNVIYKKYYKWAINEAYEFKRKYYKVCRDVNTKDLILYSQIGLIQSIQKYNASFPFNTHVKLYVFSNLCTGLSKLLPLNNIPIKNRISKKWRNKNKYLYKKLTTTIFAGDDDWKIERDFRLNAYNDKMNSENYHYKKDIIWDKINTLKTFSRRIFNLKYDYDLNKLRSNEKIAELMCCSDEMIRKDLNKTIDFLKQNDK